MLVVALGMEPAQPVAESAPVRVAAPTCPDLNPAEVQRLVTLELEAVTQQVREGPPLRVELSCNESRLRIAVTDPVTDKHLQREVPAPADEPGQERVVALAIAQLFAASWLELLLAKPIDEEEPNPVSASPGTSEHVVEAARRVAEDATAVERRDVELAVGGGVRGRSLQARPFAALHTDVELRGWLTPAVALVGRVGFDYGQADRNRGQVQGYAVMVGGGFGWRWRPRPVIALGGTAVLAAGWARLQGRTDEPTVPTRHNQGATGELTVGIGPRLFARRFRLDLDGEIGAMLRTPEGLVTREQAVSMGGLYVGAVLRLGLRLTGD